MKCPKCNFEQDKQATECEKCGLIFARYHMTVDSGADGGRSADILHDPENDGVSISFNDLFLNTKPGENPIFIFGRFVVLVSLAIWSIRFMMSPLASNYPASSFMHLANLPFHEAGHIIFRPLGAFITSLGGTLGQLLMPLICMAVFLLKTRDAFGASVTLWWFGQNFFDIAPYVNDARSLSLPLVGGNFGYSSPYGFHDWEYLLTETGLRQYDHTLAKACLVAGTVIFLVSYLWGGTVLWRQWKSRADT